MKKKKKSDPFFRAFLPYWGKNENEDLFFRTFLPNWGKNENEDKKYGKMSSIFEFSILKLGYVAILMKIWKKKLTYFLRHFWLIEAKMKMKMKKFGKISSIFEFSISTLSYNELFIKIWEKQVFFRIFTWVEDRGLKRVNIGLFVLYEIVHVTSYKGKGSLTSYFKEK